MAIPDGFWITADGRRFEISRMADGHLLNTIRVFEGRGRLRVKDSSSWEQRDTKYDELLEEAKRRGLELLEVPHPDAVKREIEAHTVQGAGDD
ncbi:MAG: hypothetical protein U0360_03640 [Dehalococcoidia bacterium]